MIVFVCVMLHAEKDGLTTDIKVLSMKIEGQSTYKLFSWSVSECEIESQILAPRACYIFDQLYIGNIILLICLIFSWIFILLATVNLSKMLRSGSTELTSLYSGIATIFSISGILTWFVFVLMS